MTHYKHVVGLTGGMGAGKSTLIAVALETGIPVYDVDATVHKLYENPQIANYVGAEIGLQAPVTRQMVAQHIVKFPNLLPRVEEIMMENLNCDLQGHIMFKDIDPFLLIDAPLLYEMGWDKHCDSVIIVQCPRAIREQRVMKRPGMTPEKMKLLMDKQMSDEERLERGNFIIYTDESIEDSRWSMVKTLEHLQEFYA